MLDGLYKLFTSLKLTVVLLSLGLVLVFLGSVAQEPFGNYIVQRRFFQVFFVDAASFYAALYKLADIFLQGTGNPLQPLDVHKLLGAPRVPVFPGGYLIGGILLVNLFAAHLRYYKPGLKKLGIAMIHLGVVLMLVGQLMTDVLSSESSMFIRNGETKNFAESNSRVELAIVDTSEADSDKVVVISDSRLRAVGDITHPELPFKVKVLKYMGNSAISETGTNGFTPVNATAGIGADAFWQEFPHVTSMDDRDMPSALVELSAGTESLGKYLVSFYLLRPQTIQHGGRNYTMALRPERFYKPFSLQLLEFRHDKYAGTDTPKNFSSRVRVLRPETSEDREVVIYMNNPLRYNGETFYQAGFDRDDQGTRLQVVHNPSAVSPYMACWIVALGLTIQFLSHFLDHLNIGINSKLSVAERQELLARNPSLIGIRGWLAVSAAGLAFVVFGWVWLHVAHVMQGSLKFVGEHKLYLTLQWILVVGFWFYLLSVGWLHLAKRRLAPLGLVLAIVLLPVTWAVLGAIGDLSSGDRSLALNSYVGASGQGLVSIFAFFASAAWILYTIRSKRVVATFIK